MRNLSDNPATTAAREFFLAGGALYGIITQPDRYDEEFKLRALARWRTVVEAHVQSSPAGGVASEPRDWHSPPKGSVPQADAPSAGGDLRVVGESEEPTP